nr:oxidoreductase [Streptomyces sp. DSM 41633]
MWVAVKKEGPQGGSAAMHQLKVGDHLKISKPRNMLGIVPDAAKHILIAGGIGLAPLMSMAFELYSWGADFELHYFGRSREEMAFDDFLTERVEYRDFVTLHIGVPRTEQPVLFEQMASTISTDTHVYT